MSPRLATPIPLFKLYGEGQPWTEPDLLHCETIPKRSRVYDWEIKPHRHADLHQLLYLHQGHAQIEVEGRRVVVTEAAVQVVPALYVHGFAFSESVEGYVVTLAAPLLARLQGEFDGLATGLQLPGLYLAGTEQPYVHGLFSALQQEYQGHQPGREAMLQALVTQALVWTGRQAVRQGQAERLSDRGQACITRYTRLIEQHYREQPSVETLAHKAGVSVAHLNTLCRALTGVSALQLIHQRILLEAKRNLTYTRMTVSQLAELLGFADPAYFSRFFRRLSGQSPKDFRQQSRSSQ